jgi:hypothetical protein
MELIKDLGQRKQGSRSYMFALFKCPTCNKESEKIKKDGLRSKSCSHKCYSSERAGIKRGAYADFVIISGYRYVYKPYHPKSIGTRKLYVAEHRMVMESYIDRFLSDNEVVHHINENTLDNRIDNLELMTASGHCKHHSSDRKRNENGQFTV